MTNEIINNDTITIDSQTYPLPHKDDESISLQKRVFLAIKEYNETATSPIPFPELTTSQKEEFRKQEHFKYVETDQEVIDPNSYEVQVPTEQEINAALQILDSEGNKRHYNEKSAREQLLYDRITERSMQRLEALHEAGDVLGKHFPTFMKQFEIYVEAPEPEVVFYDEMGEPVSDPESYEGQLYNEDLEPVDSEGNIMEFPEEPVEGEEGA